MSRSLALAALWILAACSGGNDPAPPDRLEPSTSDDAPIDTASGSASDTGSATLAVDVDADDDGFVEDVDCDDADAAVHPGASEVAYDGLDNDCDPTTPDDDLDGDGRLLVDDCDDTASDRYVGGAFVGDVDHTNVLDVCAHACEREVTGTVRVSTYEDPTLDSMAPLGCVTRIQGDLDVVLAPDAPILDMEGLEQLTAVDGSVTLLLGGFWDGQGMVTLEGLESLSTVGGDLTIANAHNLRDLDGLSGLASVGGGLAITSAAVRSIEGLGRLEEVGSITIETSHELTALDGLEGVRWTGFLHVTGNGSLQDLSGLLGLEGVDEGIWIGANPQLVDLTGLDNVGEAHTLWLWGETTPRGLGALTQLSELHVGSYVFGSYLPSLVGIGPVRELELLTVIDAGGLTSLDGLQSVEHVGTFIVSENPYLVSLDGFTPQTMDAAHVSQNRYLTDLQAFSAIDALGGDLLLDDNDQLTTLDGLNALQRVDGSVHVLDHVRLTDVTALEGLDHVGGDLVVSDNASLPAAHAAEVVDGVLQVDGVREAEGNAAL